MTSEDTTNKPFSIDKRRVYEAYIAVKSNGGAAGVDRQTIEQFEADLGGNLYKIWNRMSSGTYFPPPVLESKVDSIISGRALSLCCLPCGPSQRAKISDPLGYSQCIGCEAFWP